ncbi:hypothetical protein [Corallococcus sp. Z5C101001]|uniref:hypothetical protein n=1 Tax=Corallococcus sp. Z5C101001 TaxID=2596829 RepID=UPI00117E3B39|nr:hypothetical protein [Corallococcus sp. Z5C101001]TSC31408.1 hypothetical protein FOF48_12070 [Corallococcus sp. Z5C101001]
MSAGVNAHRLGGAMTPERGDSVVDVLRRLGFAAIARDGGGDQTVMVSLPCFATGTPPVVGYRDAVILRQMPDGWRVLPVQMLERHFGTFEAAVESMRDCLELTRTVDLLKARGFHARRHRDFGEDTLLVSLPTQRARDPRNIQGWLKTLRLRREQADRWIVSTDTQEPREAEAVVFSSLDAAATFLREQLTPPAP